MILLREIGSRATQDLVLLLQQPIQKTQIPQLGGLLPGHAGTSSVLDI